MNPLEENPFFVLELPPSATSMEVERQGKKLLSMLELGLPKARTYATPFGPRPRTAEAVRVAVQTLLDPARRLPFEPWAAVPLADRAAATDTEGPAADDGFDASALVWWAP